MYLCEYFYQVFLVCFLEVWIPTNLGFLANIKISVLFWVGGGWEGETKLYKQTNKQNPKKE